ncbi:noncompact myelin-associated protein isoform X1 [Haliaeetus albicilla]|uniref:noncompact myelin-associated protein isoform X1 n=1 Tax=Haliaeetus albicilla TaxID=8969 RepID=UPI0037E8F944
MRSGFFSKSAGRPLGTGVPHASEGPRCPREPGPVPRSPRDIPPPWGTGHGAVPRAGRAPLFPAESRIKMTTAAPLINNTQFSVNVTTKSQEQSLYQSSGAIVAAIVVGVIIIFTVVLLILKTYNRRMRVKRELEPKTTKTAMPPALGQNSNSLSQHPTVTFIPVDIHMQNR